MNIPERKTPRKRRKMKKIPIRMTAVLMKLKKRKTLKMTVQKKRNSLRSRQKVRRRKALLPKQKVRRLPKMTL